VAFIDQGYCFNAGAWDFPDSPLRGVFPRNAAYADVRGWESFEPWLTRIENYSPEVIREIAGEIPPEWVENNWEALEKLVQTIIDRRALVRDLITAFRVSSRQPFPQWTMVAETDKVQ
jgi:hypothetical protein